MIYSTSADVLGIIALCFTIFLAKRNIVIDNYKTRIYILASALTIILLTLEIASILMEFSGDYKFLTLLKIDNTISFALSPIVPYLFLLFARQRNNKINIILIIPILFNALISILGYDKGWLFTFNDNLIFVRGNFYYVTIIISLFYYLFLINYTAEDRSEYDEDDKKFLNYLFLIPILSTVLQSLNDWIIIIWGSVSLTLLLYYIFLRELQFKYDSVSGIKNRATYEREIERYQKSNDNVAIVVFDLNDFKEINDKLGHKTGDNAIYNAAKILKQSFMNIGEPYRIGGDEFSVICSNVDNVVIDNALINLEQLAKGLYQKNNVKILFAYSYAIYSKNQNQNIYDTINKADEAMYKHKAKLKGLYGRRKEDYQSIEHNYKEGNSMKDTYAIEVAGITRELPIVKIGENLSIASFVILGDTELVCASAPKIVDKLPEIDILITAEAKGIPLTFEISRLLGMKSYIVARKSIKPYMDTPIVDEVVSITTQKKQILCLDEKDANEIKGKRVAIIDDVISTGESIQAIERLVETAGGIVVAKAAILAEGDAADRNDIIFLEHLPLFTN